MKSSAQLLAQLAALAALANANPGVVVSQVLDTFRWADPFGVHATPPGFLSTCEATATFRATQHILTDLHKPPPVGLEPWAEAIKYFFGGRPFPGAWEGVDVQGVEREVIMMEYSDIPDAVKDWIEEQKKDTEGDNRFLFAVYDKPKADGSKISGQAKRGEGKDDEKVILFAAGAIYEILPLWVAEGSDCEADLRDLEKYAPEPADGSVAAWIVERTDPDRAKDKVAITFKVKAQVLAKDPAAEATITATTQAPAETAAEDSGTTEAHPEQTQSTEKDEL